MAKGKKQAKRERDFYILGPDGRTPVKCVGAEDMAEWGRQRADSLARYRVAFSGNKVMSISTIFMGMDLRGDGKVFESRIAGGPRDGSVMRSRTWEEAERSVGCCASLRIRKRGRRTLW